MIRTSKDEKSSHDKPTQHGSHHASVHRPAVSRHAFPLLGAAAPRGWRAIGATMMLAAALSACDAREAPTPKTNPGVSGAATVGSGSGGGGSAGGSAPAHAPPSPPSNPPDVSAGARSGQGPDERSGPDSRAPAGSGSTSGGAGTSGMSGSGAAAGSGGSADERR